MAEEVIKQVLISKSEFPPFTSLSIKQQKFRFRLVSQDRSQFSDWSNIYTIESADQLTLTIPLLIAVDIQPALFDPINYSQFSSAWYDLPGLSIKEYDIFLRKNNTVYEYWNTTNAQGLSAILESSITALDIIVQISTYTKKVRDNAILFTSDSEIVDRLTAL